MNKKRVFAAIAGVAVAGLVFGTAVSGFAAPAPVANQPVAGATAAAAGGNLGMRMGSAVRDAGGRLLDIVAKLTGKSTDAIVTDRQAGKTMAQIAEANGVSSSAVVAEALKVRQQVVAAQVAAGTITQAQADAALAQMQTQLADRIQTVNPSCTGLGTASGAGLGAGNGAGGMGRGLGAGVCK